MTRYLSAALFLAVSVSAQAAPVSAPYTFDYFVHTAAGPKPVLVFGTGKTTFIQLDEGVEVQRVVARKGAAEKVAEVVYSAPYTVVNEIHDSLKVSTNKGEFTVERTGAKTEVELAAERAEARAKEQAAEIAKLREEIEKQKEAAHKADEAAKVAAAQTAAQTTKKIDEAAATVASHPLAGDTPSAAADAVQGAPAAKEGDKPEATRPILVAMATPGSTSPLPPSDIAEPLVRQEALSPKTPAASKDKDGATPVTFFIRNGEGLRGALAREAQKLGMNVSWSLREDRVASRDMTFAGDTRDAVLNDILTAFRLPGYLVDSTNTLYIVKDEK